MYVMDKPRLFQDRHVKGDGTDGEGSATKLKILPGSAKELHRFKKITPREFNIGKSCISKGKFE